MADSGSHRIQVFTADGKFVSMLKCGLGRGELNFPTITAIDTNGVVYVCESNNNYISVFTPEGQFVTSFGGMGEAPRNCYGPVILIKNIISSFNVSLQYDSYFPLPLSLLNLGG